MGSSSRLQKRLTDAGAEMAAVEEEARIATTNRKTATAATIQIAATTATARVAATTTAARRTTTTTERTGPRWLPVLETRRPRQSPQSTTMSLQSFRKKTIRMQKRNKKKTLPPPEIPGRKINRLSKTLFIFLHFFSSPFFFSLSPRKADFILKTIHICFWPRSQNFLFAQKRLYQG